MNKAISVLILAIIVLASCKTVKFSSERKGPKPEKVAANILLDSLKAQKVNFQWLSIKAKVDFDNGKRSENFTANIRMRRDSVIWVAITSLMGIEVARMLITKDSVEVLDRLHKTHTKKPFSFLESYAPFPMDIGLLQNILVGNYLIDTSGDKQSDIEKNLLSLNIDNNKVNATYLMDPINYLLAEVTLKEKTSSRQLNVIASDYSNADGHNFSHERELKFKTAKSKLRLHFKYSRLTWDEPLTFPFFISDKYD